MTTDTGLDGVGVLVTRPEHQAAPLCQLIEQAGGRAIRFPVLEIADIEDKGQLIATLDRLDEFDIAIFISPNAVNKAINFIRSRRAWPAGLAIAAVGRGSAKALRNVDLEADIFPSRRFNSEALLELPEMQEVAGKRIVIFRGEGGREVLAETLRRRGAEVTYAEVYRRVKPKADVSRLMKHWARGEVDIITVTSNEALSNLFDLVGQLGRQWLQKTPLVVISERAVELARGLGFKSEILVASQADDTALLAAIRQWQNSRGASKESA